MMGSYSLVVLKGLMSQIQETFQELDLVNSKSISRLGSESVSKIVTLALF